KNFSFIHLQSHPFCIKLLDTAYSYSQTKIYLTINYIWYYTICPIMAHLIDPNITSHVFLLKKFDVIKRNIPITMRGMDNAANESGGSEIPIFLLNTTPKAADHVHMNVNTFSVLVNLLKDICTLLYSTKND